MERFPSSNTETKISQIENSGEMAPQFLGVTKDEKQVYKNPGSHFHPEDGLTYDILKSALPVIETEEKTRVEAQVDFDKPIGTDKCIEVGPEDDVIMVYRKERFGMTPMIKNRQPKVSNRLQVVLKKSREDDGKYILATSFIGEKAPREPWDNTIETEEEKKESEDFWNTHALIYDEDLVDWDRTDPALRS